MSAFKLARIAAVAAVASVAAVTGALAGPKDNSLNLGWKWVLPSHDLYFNQAVAEAQMIGRLIWDHPMERRLEEGRYEPLLATSWKWVDPVTLEFELRQGVKFHNGADFTADDFVYTANWVSNPDNNVNIQNMVSWIKSAEKVGPYTARIHLKKPFPPALDYVAATLPIYPQKYYADVGPKGMSDKPIGSGPYRVTEAVTGQNITLVRTDNYFTGGAKGNPSIQKITQRTIPEAQTQVAELLSGRIDWIWQLPPDMADSLKSRPNINVLQHESMRISYVTFDAAGRSSKALGDVRVRRAINHAINREAISKHLFPGTRLIYANCHPIQFGCPDWKDVTQYEYDPAKAKKLIAEAGFANGFDVELYAYRDRQVTDALVSDLRSVGINAKLAYMAFPAMYEKKLNWETPMVHSTTGSWNVADVLVPLSVTFQGGKPDMANDEELTKMINEAANLVDQDKRKDIYKQVYKRITDQAYMTPLTTDVVTYAFHKDLDFKPVIDEVGQLYSAKWKK